MSNHAFCRMMQGFTLEEAGDSLRLSVDVKCLTHSSIASPYWLLIILLGTQHLAVSNPFAVLPVQEPGALLHLQPGKGASRAAAHTIAAQATAVRLACRERTQPPAAKVARYHSAPRASAWVPPVPSGFRGAPRGAVVTQKREKAPRPPARASAAAAAAAAAAGGHTGSACSDGEATPPDTLGGAATLLQLQRGGPAGPPRGTKRPRGALV